MTLRNAFEDVSTEATLDNVIQVLMWILDKLPRTDANDRAVVNIQDGGAAVTISAATVTSVQSFGAANRPADLTPMHYANAGAMHIYNNIIVS